MKRQGNFFLCSIIMVLGLLLGPQEVLAQKDRPFGFNPIRKKVTFTTIPFELRANLIVVKTLVDQSDTLNFILDSGVQSIIILDSTVRTKLHTNIGRKIQISGIGESPPFSALVSLGHTVKLSGLVAYSQNLVLLQENFLDLSEYLGLPIHGIIGSDIFKRFHVEIDYSRFILTFSEPHKYKYRKRKGVALPLYLDRTKPYISLNGIENNGQKLENLNLVIDTGGAHSLLLNPESLPQEILPKKMIEGHLGRGLNGNIEGKLGRVGVLHLANQDLKNILATLPDSLVFDQRVTHAETTRHGSIGGEILKRFIVSMNYTQNLLVLKPIRKEIKKPFESDMSGIELRATGKDFRNFEVYSVIEESPAGRAGVLPGDKIIVINSKLANLLTINDLYEHFSKKEGKNIELVVLREHTLIPLSFTLQKTI
jgi:hypothetical protein